MPYLVRENLFLGNIGDAAEVIRNGSKEITHILCAIPTKEIKVYAGGSVGGSASVGDGSISFRAGKDLKLVRMGVPLRDMDDENLLDYLDACVDFIDNGRKKGSVLVHCFAGVSRSASIITAYLMRTEHLSQEDQLKMYEEMGFKVDRASPIYKSFRLKVLGESYHHGDKIDSSKFGADPGLPGEVASGVKTAQNGGKTGTPAFRCKKCRRIVALQDNVVDHIPGEGEKSFEWRKRRNSNLSEDSECSSIFVEPQRWMTAVEEGALEGKGKLSCAHCEARLGYFNWSGSQCSCGSWITPSFQLHRSRVDVSTV